MGRPQSNGLIELVDSKSQESGFFCMQLLAYLVEEEKMGTPEYADLWDVRFSQAKAGDCAYRDKCPIYARTLAKHEKKPIQLILNF